MSLRVAEPERLPVELRARAVVRDGFLDFSLAGCQEVESLLAAVRESGNTIQDMRMTEVDLEDVFVAVMQGAHDGGAGGQR